MDVAIPNSHNLHRTIVYKLQKCTDLEQDLIRMWRLKTPCIIPPVLSKASIITNTLYNTTSTIHSEYYYKHPV